MVLPPPSRPYASEIALFVTSHPSEEWLAKAKKQANDGDESETASLTIIEGDFTGWSIEKLAKYLAENFADAECPVACGSFAVADEESEETDSLLLVELTPRYLLRDRTIMIEGTMRVGPEYGVGMPVIFHGGIKSIGIFAGEPGDIQHHCPTINFLPSRKFSRYRIIPILSAVVISVVRRRQSEQGLYQGPAESPPACIGCCRLIVSPNVHFLPASSRAPYPSNRLQKDTMSTESWLP
ncbi:hypothetical protein EV421DRAFT_1831270 [Armillaria borealis]|uniref:Uncharacterized protein n=1 Tax=Armillaria borealis TaxID=47425 RepID=A0AA39MKA5_9AGAR|nr:hypothetical protein EV421DRAFT_1831270 [Armillaria borealis]